MQNENDLPPVPAENPPAQSDSATFGKGDIDLDDASGNQQNLVAGTPATAQSTSSSVAPGEASDASVLDPATTPAETYLAGIYDQLERLQDPVQRFIDYITNPPDLLAPIPDDSGPFVTTTPLQNLPPRAELLPDSQPDAPDNNNIADTSAVVDALQQNLQATQDLLEKMTSLLEQQNQRIEQLNKRLDDLESRIQDSLNK